MQVDLKVLRYDPERDEKPHWERYTVEAGPMRGLRWSGTPWGSWGPLGAPCDELPFKKTLSIPALPHSKFGHHRPLGRSASSRILWTFLPLLPQVTLNRLRPDRLHGGEIVRGQFIDPLHSIPTTAHAPCLP